MPGATPTALAGLAVAYELPSMPPTASPPEIVVGPAPVRLSGLMPSGRFCDSLSEARTMYAGGGGLPLFRKSGIRRNQVPVICVGVRAVNLAIRLAPNSAP